MGLAVFTENVYNEFCTALRYFEMKKCQQGGMGAFDYGIHIIIGRFFGGSYYSCRDFRGIFCGFRDRGCSGRRGRLTRSKTHRQYSDGARFHGVGFCPIAEME